MKNTLNTPLPEAPLLALAGRWDLTRGEHPSLAGSLAEVLGRLPLFPSREEWLEIEALGLPVQLASHGHHTILDAGPRHAANPDQLDEYPLAPVFVRDLCGRVIHTGLLPLPTPPDLPLFPAGCADVPATMVGAEHLENSIFCLWSLLDIAPPMGVSPAQQPGWQLRSAYPNPAGYPYKIRPYTFYADGWRLPQVPRLFARRNPQASSSGEAFLQRWHQRPGGQDYEAFYEANGASAWFEELFLQGVTVIPTLEAYNGAFQMNADYSVGGVEAGRVVVGLHQVAEERESSLPQGTILAVVSPGYVTATQVVPAVVVASNGPSLTPASALRPNIALPHPHLAPRWDACWLPQQPSDFTAPALWDWVADGRFCQVAGPLWCPQHYVYASTGSLIRAGRQPLPQCPSLFTLPEKLRTNMAPVVPLGWYDTLNENTRLARANSPEHPLHGTALDTLPLGQTLSPVGYHPLPPAWPTLQQASLLPEPRQQAPAPCPPALMPQLAAHATPGMDAAALGKHHQALSEPMRAALQAAQTAPSYAHAVDWLPELPTSQLNLNVKRLFASRQLRATLTLYDAALPTALFRFKETALAWRRLRYRLVTKYPAAWQHAEAQGLSLSTAEGMASVMPEAAHTSARQQRLDPLTRVPAPSASALQPAGQPARVKLKKRIGKPYGTR